MIDAQGTIISRDGDYAVVRMDEAGCGRCNEPGGCGGQNIGKMFCSTPRTFRVRNPGQAAVGDSVRVAIAEGAVRRTAVLAYGLPLLALFVCALGGKFLAGEPGAMLGAFAGLLGGWLLFRRNQSRSARDERFQPFIRT